MATDNFRKHTSGNPLQQFLIRRFNKALLDAVRAGHPETVLDAGCGEGFILENIRSEGIVPVIEGIDIREEALATGRILHPSLTLRYGSIYSLPYPDKSFDTVICSEVLEHLERPKDALSELARVARKGCVISVPNEPLFRIANLLRGKNVSRWGNDIEHIQHWSPRGIGRLVSDYFVVRAIRTPFPWTLIVGEKRA